MDKTSGSWFTRFKHKNENLALILVGLFIILLIVFIVIIASNHPWMPFKFNPEEFGTVSDWVMVIVTLVTAVFLYQTLRSQMTVQRDQNRIFKMEELKYLRAIKPEITVKTEIKKYHQSKEDLNKKALEIDVTIESDKTAIYQLNVSSSSKNLLSHPPSSLSPRSSKSFNVIHYFDNISGAFEALKIEVEYQDIDRNQYCLVTEWVIFDDTLCSEQPFLILQFDELTADKLIKPVY